MGLYKASNLGSNVASKRRSGSSKVDDPNSPKNLARNNSRSDSEVETDAPRKRLIDMTLDEQIDAAKDRILDIVSRAPRTTFEVREKLLKKGFKEIAIDKAVARLEEVGVLNDTVFAEQWTYSRFHYAGRSTYVIAQELKRKGLPEETIESAIESINDIDTQRTKAEELASEKARALAKSKPALDSGDAKKIAAMLARRGFPAGLCFDVASSTVKEYGIEIGDTE